MGGATTVRRVACSAVILALAGLGGVQPAVASLSRPDAMLYGRVSVNGQPVVDGVVSVRSGDVVLDSSAIGSNATAPDFYGLSIPMSQGTGGVGAAADGLPDGSPAKLYLGERFLSDVVLKSGSITRVEVSGGQALCNGGANDGAVCGADGDCPGGFCVFAKAICDGGGDDGRACECIGGACSDAVACSTNESMGTCSGGGLAGSCCDVALNCADGAACAGTQKLCQGGTMKGIACLRDAQCPGSSCVSTALVCNGGSEAGFSCVDDGDCPDGTCGVRISTPTATPTRTPTPGRTFAPTDPPTATPSPTVNPSGCAGDCDGSGEVAIAELIRMVNIALGRADVSLCDAGDGNQDGMISISELIRAVNRALTGCDG